jgi:peptidoglycan hydrolase-like protein with peptidoglycan-binding domain
MSLLRRSAGSPGLTALAGIIAVAVILPVGLPLALADEGDIAPPAPAPTGERSSHGRSAARPWSTPTRPAPCTDEQADTGDVAGCLLVGPGGTNAERGFGSPPFPEPEQGPLLPWQNLRIGDTGQMVTIVQAALRDRGYSLSTDGAFGPMTEAVVEAFQKDVGLRRNGIVTRATADALGVERREQGAFPPSGWNWLGWGYNGSAALADWERTMVPSRAVPGFSAGRIRANPAVIGLFEGFMTEITALGYDIDVIGSYVFRCTSGAGKTCAGRLRTSLSNHAYGTALDMNTADNPELTYYARDGVSACAVPMRTDMPHALIRAAETWGLYWGGYGWYGGCASPREWKSSTHRDPMHFEFRGDVFNAQAIIAHNTDSRVPRRWCGEILNIENGRAQGTSEVCSNSTSPPEGAAIVVPVAPASATAAAVSITATGPAGVPVQVTSCVGAVRWRTLITTSTRAASVGTLVPLHDGRMCVRVPDGVTLRISRTALWTAGTGLGLETLVPRRQVVPAADGTVTAPTSGAAAWVSAEPVTSTRLAASRCSSADPSAKRVAWFADPTVEELQIVPLTDVGGTSVWCLQRSGVQVTHVARFLAGAGAGLTPSVRRVSSSSVLPDGTRAAVVEVQPSQGDVTVGVCRNGSVVSSRTVAASPQVSTVLVDVPRDVTTDLSLCVEIPPRAQVHLLGHFADAAVARMVMSGPRTVATIRA